MLHGQMPLETTKRASPVKRDALASLSLPNSEGNRGAATTCFAFAKHTMQANASII